MSADKLRACREFSNFAFHSVMIIDSMNLFHHWKDDSKRLPSTGESGESSSILPKLKCTRKKLSCRVGNRFFPQGQAKEKTSHLQMLILV